MKLNFTYAQAYADQEDVLNKALKANQILHSGTGAGNTFLGWMDLPETIRPLLGSIKEVAGDFRERLDTIVVVGIGGSYLGARATIEALQYTTPGLDVAPVIHYAGHHLDEAYHARLLQRLESRNWGMVVISKSGTTTEPAIAFRLLRAALIRQFGPSEMKKRIIAITDASHGALRTLADQEGYPGFIIPDDVGGRFSVLSPVGLVPIAIAGIDVEEIVDGAALAMDQSRPGNSPDKNPAARYAAARMALYQAGKKIELLSNFNPALHFLAEWWKQLYGESEGKEHKGIFPASADLTTDLHSMGQYIQEGERHLFETSILISKGQGLLSIPSDEQDLDQLNFLTGRELHEVNEQAAEGTLLAHYDGGVPVIRLELEALSPFAIGELYYFFEKACGISGYLLDVNPFDQPGVEAYKKNMFALLGKKGFEKETAAIRQRLS